MKAWEVSPIDQEWSVIIHEDTRGKAIARGCGVEFTEFTEMSARRIPNMDDKTVTKELMIEAGWLEEAVEEPFHAELWTFPCLCEHCER